MNKKKEGDFFLKKKKKKKHLCYYSIVVLSYKWSDVTANFKKKKLVVLKYTVTDETRLPQVWHHLLKRQIESLRLQIIFLFIDLHMPQTTKAI